MQFVWAMRPVMGLFAIGLCLVGFKLQKQNLAELPLTHLVLVTTTIFVICSLSMVRNDLLDRRRDIKKGKWHATKNVDAYITFSVRLAMLSGFLLGFIWRVSRTWAVLTAVLTVLSIYYVVSYRKLLLPTLIVAFCAASPVLYSLLWQPRDIYRGCVLCLVIFFATLAREILKDIDDADGDVGYKRTLPVVYGVEHSWKVAACVVGLAAVVCLFGFSGVFTLVSVGLGIAAAVMWRVKQTTIGKLAIDCCCMMLIVGILAF